MGYSRSMIVDADDHDRVIAFTEGQGVRIGVPPEGLEKMPEAKLEIVDSPDLPPLWQAFGASRRDDGHWVFPELSVELASPDAALHIGPQHVVLETAAIDMAAELVGTEMLQMQAWHVMFLARGKVGPFRVEGQAVRGTAGKVGARMVLHDEGDDDRARDLGVGGVLDRRLSVGVCGRPRSRLLQRPRRRDGGHASGRSRRRGDQGRPDGSTNAAATSRAIWRGIATSGAWCWI